MSELIDKVARERYLRGDEKVMDDVYERVAVAVGENVKVPFGPTSNSTSDMTTTQLHNAWSIRFFNLMRGGVFLPNSPTLMNAGTETPMLSACFGLPVNDSFEGPGGIYDSLINSARIFKMGGGVGYNFSNLRSKGAKVQSTDGVASGPVSFMRLYDANVGVIKQGGRRRGAAIGILNVDHADIREFITCKSKEGDISNFNISVMLTDVFMEHIHDVAGKEIFDMIVDGIYNNGEPGVLFYDNMNIDNPNKHIYDIHTTNPCGELPIGVDSVSGGGEACNLGSINVAKCVNEKYPSNFDWNMLTDITRDATVFLDTIIDMNEYPTKAIGDMTKSTRKIGLGLMGLHDALIMMGYGYDSHDGRMMAKNIMLTIQNVAQETSQKLALELGCYPEWYGSEWEKKNIPMRNSTLTCVAPTGTISILAKCSSGIEPHYNWVYQRANTMDGEYLICVPIFDEMITKLVNEMSPPDIKKNLYEYYNVIVFDTVDSDEWYIQNSDDTEYFGDIREKFIDCIKQDCYEKGTIQHMKFIPEETRRVYVNALDINWIDHLEMQGELQKWCDNSISKCVAKGTLIQTSMGIIPIEELGNARGEDVFDKCIDDLYVNDEYGLSAKVISHYSGGIKKTLKIKMNNGATLEGTPTHRVMTTSGWKPLCELSVGDLIKNRNMKTFSQNRGGCHIDGIEFYHGGRGCNQVNIPTHMTPELAKILGMICSDGYTNEETGMVSLTTADNIVENEFRRLVKYVFGVNVKVVYDPRTTNTRTVAFTSRSTVRWINALIGEGCRGKCAPWQILQGSDEEMIAFMEGVTLDGYLKPVGNHKVDRKILVIYDGYSHKLREQIYSMLVYLGASPYKGKKHVKYNNVSHGYSYAVSVDKNVIVPIEIHKQRELNTTSKFVMSNLEIPTVSPNTPLYVSLERIRKRFTGVIKDTTCTKYGIPFDDTAFYTRVVEIEESEAEVYDIEVEGTHSYCVDGIISHNTINMPNDVTKKDVADAIKLAWKLGCKGFTMYREGSRKDVVLKNKTEPFVKVDGVDIIPAVKDFTVTIHKPIPMQSETKRVLPSTRYKVQSGCGELYIHVAEDNGKIREVFVECGGSGGCAANNNAIGRLISLGLKYNVPINAIIRQLKKVKCDACLKNGSRAEGKSCADIIGRVLEESSPVEDEHHSVNLTVPYSVSSETFANIIDDAPVTSHNYLGVKCSECGVLMIPEGNCYVCQSCGNSRCG